MEAVRLSPLALSASEPDGGGGAPPCCNDHPVLYMTTDYLSGGSPNMSASGWETHSEFLITPFSQCSIAGKTAFYRYFHIRVRWTLKLLSTGSSQMGEYTLSVCLHNNHPGISLNVCPYSGSAAPLISGTIFCEPKFDVGTTNAYQPDIKIGSEIYDGSTLLVTSGCRPIYLRGVWCK